MFSSVGVGVGFYAGVCVVVCVDVRVYVSVYIGVCMGVCINTHIHKHIQFISVFVWAYVQTHTYTHIQGKETLITDTVGFIQKLPTKLVSSFRATLEELEDASLILHVVDASSPLARQQVRFSCMCLYLCMQSKSGCFCNPACS